MLKMVGGLVLAVFVLLSGTNNANAGMFGYGETQYSGIRDFKKWNDALQRHEVQNMAHSAYLQKWKQDIAKIATLPSKAEQVVAVNSYINNAIVYEDDAEVWGKSDYWATPAETFSKGRGDCDDYAIAKFESLKMLGFTENELRIVVLNDERKNILHAVLSVNINGANYILDNQARDVIADTQIAYYSPIYSIGERNWWKHS
jgi:predicted transglutaminase-like cysteine proteinase